jgi:GxxExxY protein
MEDLIYKEETYDIIGICMEVHKNLGRGHSEAVYKDALEYEFKLAEIEYLREKPYKIEYKDIVLTHFYIADFIVFDTIILEVKAIEALTKSHTKQTINYLAASKLKVGLLVNFGEDQLTFKRVIL